MRFRTNYRMFFVLLMTLASPSLLGQPLRNAPFLPNPPITVGETLIYDVKLGGIAKAGQQLLQVVNRTTVKGQSVYQLKSEAMPDSYLDRIYHFADRKVSFVGVDDYLPVRYEKSIEDGKYSGSFITEFNRDTKTAEVWKDGKRQKDARIPADAHDELSMVYFFRTKELRAGEDYETSFFSGSKLFDVRVRVMRMEWYTAPAPMGRIKVYRIEASDGFTCLVTADRFRIPVKIEVPLKIKALGKLVATLRSWDGIR